MFARMFALMMALVVTAGAFAQQAAPAKLVEKQPYVLGPAVVQEYPEQRLLFVIEEATPKTLPDVMRKLTPHLLEMAKQSGVLPGTPIVINMSGVTADPNAKIEVEVGFIVQGDVKPAEGLEVRVMPAGQFATMLYTGNMQDIGKAYENLFMSVMANGRMPTGELRQMVLYVEDEASKNNVMLVMVALQ